MLIGTGCSDSEHEGAVGTERMEEGVIRPGEENEGGGTAAGTADARERNSAAAEGGADHLNNGGGSSVDREKVAKIEAARAERKANSDELNGLRSHLLAELEEVRAALKDGTRTTEQRNEDQARAAALAQGLQRLDRALEAIEASSEATWQEIKAHSDKEVKELRAWMKENDVEIDS